MRRHLTATFVGRFPRLWFFAALGLWWNVGTGVLVGVSVGSIALAVSVYMYKSWRPTGTEESGESPELEVDLPTAAVGSRSSADVAG